jgi:peptidoglycan LD-endopeptidase LytH
MIRVKVINCSNMVPNLFEERLRQYSGQFHPVVPFEKSDKVLLLDFTDRNTELTDKLLKDTNLFTKYINGKLEAAGAKYGIGGYAEHRTIYKRSEMFNAAPPQGGSGRGTALACARCQ